MALSRSRGGPLNPVVIWRWGFTAALVGIGIWLVLADPAVGGSHGRLLGWIVIAYGLVRLLLNKWIYRPRGQREFDG